MGRFTHSHGCLGSNESIAEVTNQGAGHLLKIVHVCVIRVKQDIRGKQADRDDCQQYLLSVPLFSNYVMPYPKERDSAAQEEEQPPELRKRHQV